jgi:hypothetical protein
MKEDANIGRAKLCNCNVCTVTGYHRHTWPGIPFFGFRRPPHSPNGHVVHFFPIMHVTSFLGDAGDLGTVRDRILGNR